ncbi:toxin-antitoxin system TumE family protein [Fictibacillus sp. BK138]|uniref:toxin-antitoxin system TumE family protein n=1 Tax=Fictibacillus sp. BK138 TaxID=2512121 RepID=UPI00102A9E45|nr:DUF6516 family protein [Fictibacillus sp. BK138]RZT21443.1 hypothetical protein EV282_0505 [Fictibacillus sp. BK138]
MGSFQSDRLQFIQKLFEENPRLFEHKKYSEIVRYDTKGSKKIITSLPLQDHKDYGETILFISEKLSDTGQIIEYHYAWELSQRRKKMGKQPRHIMAFGNENHEPGTHAWVPSNPYHHHHVPNEPKKRKETTVEELHRVIEILTDYIHGGLTYESTQSF